MEIPEALVNLNTKDDSQWTGEGLPRVEFVGELVGRTVTRQEVTDAAPHFTRENPVIEEMSSEEKLSVAEKQVEKAEIEVAEASDEAAQAQTKRAAAQVKLQQALKEKAKHEDPPHVANQKRIMAYIESQKKERARRAEARQKLLGGLGGVPLDTLDPRAPIDKAYSGGQKRPEGG